MSESRILIELQCNAFMYGMCKCNPFMFMLSIITPFT